MKRIIDNAGAAIKSRRRLVPEGCLSRGCSCKAERVRFLRVERHTPLSGGPGIDPLDITVGVPGAWLRRERWSGNARPAHSRDARPGPNRVQPKAARGKPRRSAERRARPERVAVVTPQCVARLVMRMRLSALRLPLFFGGKRFRAVAWQSSGAKEASRERGCSCIVIASAAKQSRGGVYPTPGLLRRFAPRNDGVVQPLPACGEREKAVKRGGMDYLYGHTHRRRLPESPWQMPPPPPP